MTKYGQYCPIAQALELLGDRWTLLIIRDMLTGTRHFNDLQRGLPGLSRALLAKRLQQLQAAAIIDKQVHTHSRQSTEYTLTPAGRDLLPVINALLVWGATWAFGDPTPDELDPLLLMWWMHDRVNHDQLPTGKMAVQFDFYGAQNITYWLLLAPTDVSVCMTPPGHEIKVLVTADLATYFKLWLGRISYAEALAADAVTVEGQPRLVRAFPTWFAWSAAAPVVSALRSGSATRS